MASPDLGFTVGDKTWEKLRQRAIDDFYFFCASVLGYADVFPLREDTHRIPLLFMSRKTGCSLIDEAQYQLLMWPRETGKSTLGTVGYAIWRAVQHPDIAILIANESAKLASDFVQAIEAQFETNAFLRALFPEVIPPDLKKTTWAATRATLERKTTRPEATFDSIGVGGAITGYHPDLILCDDLISVEAYENARTGVFGVVDRVNRWINRLEPLLSSSAKPFPEIRFIGTRWFQGDSYEWIEESYGHGEPQQRVRITAKLSDGSKVSREVYRVSNLAVMRIAAIEDGACTFPKIWSMDRIAEWRMRDPELVACNLMNDPSGVDIRTFQDAWLRWWQWLDKRLISYRKQDGTMRYVAADDLYRQVVVDPAFTARGDGSRAAMVVTGTDQETGITLVLDVYADRVEPKDLVSDLLNLAHKWRTNKVYIESVAQQAAFIEFVRQEARRKNLPLMIEEVKPGGRAKDMRIESLAAYFKAAQIYLHPQQEELLREYRSFRPGSRLKDILDALAYAAEKWPKVATVGGGWDAKTRAKSQLASYRARRGLKVS